MKGKVKFFDGAKGYGFIECPNHDDVFVHCTNLVIGLRILNSGDEVEFDLGDNKPNKDSKQGIPIHRSKKAVNVRVISKAKVNSDLKFEGGNL